MLPSDTAKKDFKIMVVYASYGEGHLQAARAIRDQLSEQGIHRTILIDLMAEAHPWISAFTKRFYMRSFSFLPGVYGWIYNRTREMRHDSLFGDWLHSFGRNKMRRLLVEEQPDAVIHTFPMYVMPALGGKPGARRIPSCAIVTDFDLHGRWIHPGIDRYYVPTDDVKREIVAHGIPEHRVLASGIPLKEGFSELRAQPEFRQRFGFAQDERIVLVMAGAQGVMPDIDTLCSELLDRSALSVALVCGRNAALARSVREAFAAHHAAGRLHVFDYVERMHELMAVSACLVTKPGGITLTEGLAAGLPIFTYRPVPGQETGNADYLQRRGAGDIAHKPRELAEQILRVMADPERIAYRKQALAMLRKERSAETIVLDLLPRLNIMEGKAPSSQPSSAAASSGIPT